MDARPDETSASKIAAELERLVLENARLRQQAPLEAEKLRLEIRALRGWRATLANPFFPVVATVMIAVVGWVIQSAFQADTAKQQNQTRRDELYAALLERIADPNPNMRLVAAVDLTRLATEEDGPLGPSVAILVSRLETEGDPAVLEQVVREVRQLRRPALHAVTNANRRAVIRLARAAGRFVGLQLAARDVFAVRRPTLFPDELDLTRSPRIWATIVEIRRGLSTHLQRAVALYEQNRLTGGNSRTTLEDLMLLDKTRAAFRKSLLSTLTEIRFVRTDLDSASAQALHDVELAARNLAGTSAVLTRFVFDSLAFWRREDLHGAVFVSVDMSGADFRAANLRGAYMGADLAGAKLDSCDLSGAFIRGSLDSASLCDATLVETLFPLDFDPCKDRQPADLRGANWEKALVGDFLVDQERWHTSAPQWPCLQDTASRRQ